MITREIEIDRFTAKSDSGKLCIILVYQQYINAALSRIPNEKFRVQNDMLLSMDSTSTLLILKRLRSPRPGRDLKKSDWFLDKNTGT